MENLPRISVLSLPLKTSGESPDLTPMAKAIEMLYQQTAEMYKKEFTEFQVARKAACEPSIDYTGLSKQKRYYAQLQLAKGRFNFSAEKDTAVLWSWYDAFSNSLYESLDIGFEEAAILFNIAALHTMLGSRERRVDADSMKVACTHFQCAAWALETFAERHSAEATGDLNAELIRAFGSLMTAQAQECIVEKSVLDGRPANITAKLTQYLTEAYEQVATRLSTPAVIASLPPKYQKDWRRRCLIKSSYYAALVAYFAGFCEESDRKYGKAIAWFQLAQKRIADAEKVAKELKENDTTPVPLVHGNPLRVNVQFVADAIQTKLTGLIKDNDFIYHEVVPSPESLEQIKAACLVKGVPFDYNDPEIRGADIFQRLVPMKTLEATSVYSEHKAALLRGIASEVDDKEAAIELFLSSIDIGPETMMQPDPPLPQELYDVCTRISALEHGPERDLSNHMQKLVKESTDVEAEAERIIETIDGLKIRLDALSSIKSGDRIKSIQNSVTSLGERCQGLNSTLQLARTSNLKLREILGMHLETLKRLTTPAEELFSKLPSVKPILEDDTVTRIVTEAKRLFSKVDEMRRQRVDLITQLRQALHQDDITGDLLTASVDPSGLEEVFKSRLKKHDPLVGLLRQNLVAQENIESALIDLNAEFAPNATKLRELRQKRTEEIQHLLTSSQVYVDVVDKCQEGLKFYVEIARRLSDLRTELEQVVEQLMAEESRPENILQPQTTSTTISSMAPCSRFPQPASSSATQPTYLSGFVPPIVRPGQIPTLGDYMASMRQRSWDQQSGMAMGAPRSVPPPSWPNAASTTVSNFPHPVQQPALTGVANCQSGTVASSTTPSQMRYGPPRQGFMPPQTPSMFMTNHPSGNLTGSTYSASVASQPQSSVVFRPVAPTSYPNQPLPAQLPYPAPQPNQPHFAMSQPSTMPMSAAPQRQDLPHTTPPNTHMPYSQYTASSAQPRPTQFGPGWPTSSNVVSGYPSHSSLMQQRQSTPVSQLAPQASVGNYGQQLITNHYPSGSQPQTIFRQPLPSESHNPALTQTQIRGQSERHPAMGTGSAPSFNYPVPFNTTQGQRFPFNGQPPQSHAIGPTFPTAGTVYPNTESPNLVQSQYPATSGSQFCPTVRPLTPSLPQAVSQAHSYPMPPSSATAPPANHQSHSHSFAPATHPSESTRHLAVSSIEANTLNPAPATTTATASNSAAALNPPPDSTPLQPHILTKADFDAQRREERLRATYGSSSHPQTTIPFSGPESGLSTRPSGVVVDPKRLLQDPPGSSLTSITSAANDHNNNSVSTAANKDRSSTNLTGQQIDPLSDPLILNPFIAATENLLTWIEHLHEPVSEDSKQPGVVSRLDKAWARVQAIANERSSSGKKPTQAAAMCCPTKNRRQDCVPYDTNRVVLDNSKNDYINASHIDFLSCFGDWSPRYIVAQAPMHKTVADFWHMILAQGCEVVVFLPPLVRMSRPSSPGLAVLAGRNNTGVGDYGDPTNPLAIPQHLPANKVGSRFTVPGSNPPLELRLQALKTSDQSNRSDDVNRSEPGGYMERILTVRNTVTEQTRSLVHLTYNGPILQPKSQLTGGTGGDVDQAIEPFCAFVNHVHTYYKQQRNLLRPIAVVCEYGAGFSGIFVAASVSLLHAERLGRVADLIEVAGRLLQQRRAVLGQPGELVTAARVVAHAAVEAVAKRDIVVGPRRRSSTNISSRTADSSSKRPVPREVSSTAATNPMDTLFSDRPLQLSELMSVVDRWNIGTPTTETQTGVNENNTSTNQLQNDLKLMKAASFIAPVNIHDQFSESLSATITKETTAKMEKCQETTSDLDRLIDLSTLGSADTSGRRRYHRTNSDTITRPPASDGLMDPFCHLDPFHALTDCTGSSTS